MHVHPGLSAPREPARSPAQRSLTPALRGHLVRLAERQCRVRATWPSTRRWPPSSEPLRSPPCCTRPRPAKRASRSRGSAKAAAAGTAGAGAAALLPMANMPSSRVVSSVGAPCRWSSLLVSRPRPARNSGAYTPPPPPTVRPAIARRWPVGRRLARRAPSRASPCAFPRPGRVLARWRSLHCARAGRDEVQLDVAPGVGPGSMRPGL